MFWFKQTTNGSKHEDPNRDNHFLIELETELFKGNVSPTCLTVKRNLELIPISLGDVDEVTGNGDEKHLTHIIKLRSGDKICGEIRNHFEVRIPSGQYFRFPPSEILKLTRNGIG